MNDKVAGIGIEIEINADEYSQGAQKATTETKKLAESARQLDGDLKHAQSSASKAGAEINRLGTDADKTGKILERLRGQLGAGQLAGGIMSGLGLGGVMSGAGALAALVGAATGASEANANAIAPFGLASGGNPATLAAMTELYKKINQSSTITPQKSGDIAKLVTNQFGWMSPADRESFANRIAGLGELGEDTSSLLKSLFQISKHMGAEYGFGEYTMPDLLGRLGYTASQTGTSVSNVAAGVSTILQSSEKTGISASDAMKMLIAGYQEHGSDTYGSVARVIRGVDKSREKTNLQNEDFRRLHPSVREQIWAAEFPRSWESPLGNVNLDTNTLFPTEQQQQRREAELGGKNFATVLGELKDMLAANTVFRKPLYEQYLQQVRNSPRSNHGNTVNVYQTFSAITDPNVEIQKAGERESAKMANRVH